MALFKRKKKESVLPEVDKYYEAERRDRTGLAWLLAFVSIILVALFIIIVFFAGRWAYRAIFDNNQDVATTGDTTQVDTPSFDGQTTNEDANKGSGETTPGNTGDTELDQPQPQEPTEPEGNVDAPARTDVPSTPTPAPTVPVTGDDPLPNTGPESLVTLFVGVSALAGGSHYAISRKRQK